MRALTSTNAAFGGANSVTANVRVTRRSPCWLARLLTRIRSSCCKTAML